MFKPKPINKLELDRYITLREEEHNQELYRLEKKLEEYIGLTNEKDIKIEEGYLSFCKRLRLSRIERYSSIDDPELDALGDWDFFNINYGLDTTRYVSSPSSLKCWDVGRFLCRVPDTLQVREGRLVTYLYIQEYGKGYIIHFDFRSIAPLGEETSERYSVLFSTKDVPYTVRAWRYTTELYSKSLTSEDYEHIPINTFHRYRVTWWVFGGILYIRFESETDGDWYEFFTVEDPTNKYATEEYNRVGMCWYMSAEFWVDDTEIWKAV